MSECLMNSYFRTCCLHTRREADVGTDGQSPQNTDLRSPRISLAEVRLSGVAPWGPPPRAYSLAARTWIKCAHLSLISSSSARRA